MVNDDLCLYIWHAYLILWNKEQPSEGSNHLLLWPYPVVARLIHYATANTCLEKWYKMCHILSWWTSYELLKARDSNLSLEKHCSCNPRLYPLGHWATGPVAYNGAIRCTLSCAYIHFWKLFVMATASLLIKLLKTMDSNRRWKALTTRVHALAHSATDTCLTSTYYQMHTIKYFHISSLKVT